MAITRGLEVRTRREMVDLNELIIPENTLLKIQSACFEFDSELYELTGEVDIDGVKERVKLWAYINDFIPIRVLSN